MDSDGDMNLLGAALMGGSIIWWANKDGSGTSWTEHLVDERFDGAVSLCAGDFAGNSLVDVLGGAEGSDEIVWWTVAGCSQGFLESSILDIQEQPEWQYIE